MTLTAADIMTRNVICASSDDTVATVARLLCDHDISAVPVRDASGRIIGIVSEGDLVTPPDGKDSARRAWWLQLMSEGESSGSSLLDCIARQSRPIDDLIVRTVVTATPDASMAQLAELMVNHGIKRLPILRDETLVGIVSRADIIRAMSRTPDKIAESL